VTPTAPTLSRPAYRPYRATVRAVTRLSPSFVRVTFAGEDFDTFAEHARDQRVKIVFPGSPRCFDDLGVDDEDCLRRGDWYDRWRSLPDDRRSPFRTYTVRGVDAPGRLVDIDFVAHHEDGQPSGPGSSWLEGAVPGDEVIVVGPDARSENSHVGMDWRPGEASDVLLLGDETAAPAIAGILERLPADRRATALIEVPTHGDALRIDTTASADIRYLPRDGQPVGALLEPALRAWVESNADLVTEAASPIPQTLDDVDVDVDLLWESPDETRDGGFYAWIAGESAVIKRLRRILVTELGADRHRVAFMGYWRLGQSERTG
jgi:NADPH-dependent ferric siderophore reductase